jgi:hypothetical protein
MPGSFMRSSLDAVLLNVTAELFEPCRHAASDRGHRRGADYLSMRVETRVDQVRANAPNVRPFTSISPKQCIVAIARGPECRMRRSTLSTATAMRTTAPAATLQAVVSSRLRPRSAKHIRVSRIDVRTRQPLTACVTDQLAGPRVARCTVG